MADDYSAIATPVSAQGSDDYGAISSPVAKAKDEYADVATPTSNVVTDTAQRLGESLWRGFGNLFGGLSRLEKKLSPSTYEAHQEQLKNAGLRTNMDVGAEIASVADTGTQRTDPARDKGFPALAAEMVGGAAPAFALGPLAPLGMGAMISDQEKRRSLAEGDAPDVAEARADLGLTVGTAAGMIPVLGKSIATKALTGGAGNLIGDIAIEGAQGRKVSAEQAAKAFGIGALFGGGMGVAEKIGARPAPKPKESFSIVSAMDADTHGTPSAANVAANDIAMRPVEPTPAPEPVVSAATLDEVVPGAKVEPAPKKVKMDADTVDKMSGDDFMAHYSKPENAITNDAVEFGESVTDPKQIEKIKGIRDELRDEVKGLIADKKFDEATGLSYKSQWFNEAYESATKSGGFEKGGVDLNKAPEPEILKNFDEKWKEQGGMGGHENQVVIEDGTVYKRNYNTKLGQKLVYHEGDLNLFKDSIALHNELFPSTKMKFEGFSDTSDGPAPVISMPEIKGKPATQKEIKAFMEAKGFKSDGGWSFVNKEAGIRAEDLRPANVLKDESGQLQVIDSVIKRIEPTVKETPAATPLQSASEAFSIPKELSKSNPGYSYGQKRFAVSFESDLDKALYVVANDAKRSARDADFLKLVMDHTGMTEQEARAAGQVVRNEIKQMAKVGEDGEILSVPEIHKTQEAPLAQAKPVETVSKPKVAAKPIEPSIVEPLVSEPALQKVADDVEVAEIMAEPPPPPTKPPVATSDMPVPAPKGPQPGAYKPGLTSMGLGMGKAAEFLKVAVGTIEGNIRDANKKIFGTLRNYEYDKSQLSLKLEQMTMPASRLSRKILSKEGNDVIGNLLMSGKVEEAKAIVAKDTRYGPEFEKAIDDVRAALDYTHELNKQVRGEENSPYIKDYFPRQLVSYPEFRAFLGKAEQSTADAAIRRAQEKAPDPLTKEQVEDVLNNLVSQSRINGGKPGYLKARTIQEIDSNFAKFYEPWDVALENHLRRATNDVVNRSYFGKAADGAEWNPDGGSFGKVLADEIAAGRLQGKAQSIVIDNLQDRFKMEHATTGIMADIGRKIRFAQSAAYLGQIQTAVAQFGDIFGSILHQGPLDTAKGYARPRFKLRDIGIHEGNVETAQFSRNKGAVDKAANLTIKFGVGLSDQFNKGGVANAIALHYADVMKNPNSDAFKRLNRDYSAKFPEQWPAIQKELMSKDFADSKIKDLPMAQFFLYNEMADIHPINPSGMAQGFNAAHPLAKPFWGLKSYMIKQLDIMRARGYEKIKDPRSRMEGLAYLAAYGAVVAAGQNFAVSWLRDKLADRETDTSDYFVGGFLQPLGLSRYTIMQVKKGEVGKAMVESLLPVVSLGKEAINDMGKARDLVIGRRDRKTGERTVKDLGDLVSQSETVKHFPIIGSLYYSRFGKGHANEMKHREEKARGKGQPNTVETISDIISPQETAGR